MATVVKKIVILHVPSEPVAKGTDIIKKNFTKLSKKYNASKKNNAKNAKNAKKNYDFRILPPMSHDQLLQEMAKADIIVDQLVIGWYGGQAVEALAMGKIVMAYLEPIYLNLVSFSQEIPIVNTNPWSFGNDLENLLKITPLIKNEWAARGRKFVRKVHDSAKIAEKYADLYRSLI
jgi:glycosyltransferase involved in cell wall biosynthesis